MPQETQTVIYRLNSAHEPAWQYHSMPESIVGGGVTLDAARADYRDALLFSLGTDVLPEIHEYLEGEISNQGIWLRIPLGLGELQKLLQDVEQQIDPEDRDWFFAHPTVGGEPVILTTLPTMPLHLIFDQMSVYDYLIIAMRYHGGAKLQNVFVAFAGPEIANAFESPMTLESMGLSWDSPLSALLEVAIEHHLNATTVRVPALC